MRYTSVLCDFARAALYCHPWYIRSDVLVQNHSNMRNIILALLNMNRPHASASNILNFMWCLWKARNDYLFDRKKALPHHVNIVANSLSSESNDLLNISQQLQPQTPIRSSTPTNQIPLHGHTFKFDLLIVGSKVYHDAAFKCKKVPGLM